MIYGSVAMILAQKGDFVWLLLPFSSIFMTPEIVRHYNLGYSGIYGTEHFVLSREVVLLQI